MASITLLLKDNKVDQNGEMPIYLRIIKGRKAKFISLGYKVNPALWDEAKMRVKKGYPNSARMNAFLATKVAEAEDVALTMETGKKQVSSRKIKEGIMGSEQVSIIKYLEGYAEELNSKSKVGTYRRVKAVTAKLKEFNKGADLSFDELDYDFLKRYEKYLREEKSNAVNTINANFKIFKKVFNDAIREDLIQANINPFLKYRSTSEKSKKEYLTEDEIDAIDKLSIKENTVMFHHRNMYIFACYAGGIRISDLLQLKWENFDGTHINLMTQKTKDTLSIKLPQRALEMIRYYEALHLVREPGHYIFPFLKNGLEYTPETLFNAISSNTAYVNKNLREIGRLACIEKKVSFHTSRHSFATRALRKGMRIEYVSRLLSHKSIQVTQVYAKIINEELDKAMDVFN
jgi:integrase/recombinase XerD